MTAVLATRLPHRGLLRLSGAEALAFLDRLVTIEASHIADGAAGFAALLSPQGKILADFFLFRLGEEVILDCPRAALPDLANFVGDAPILGQNIGFDLAFLQKAGILRSNPPCL